jgi:hypothetical protein
VVYARFNEQEAGGTLALPLDGGPPVQVFGTSIQVKWSPDAKLIFLRLEDRSTYVVPLPPGRMFPVMPPGGFKSEAEIARIPAVRIISSAGVAPGLSPEVYAFTRETVQRNLYRIPVP